LSEAEAALQESEALLALAQRLAGLGSWEFDPKANKTVWSGEMFRIHGLEPDAGVPSFESLAGLVHPDDLAVWLAANDELKATGAQKDFEYRIIRADGDCRWLLAHQATHPLSEGGGYKYYGTIMDITERKKIEQMKDDFVSMVSHELRTPLTAIKEGISMVFDGVGGEISTEQKEYLACAKRNVDRLALLINDVLDFQKMQSGKLMLSLSEVSMATVVNEVAQMMAPAVKSKGLDLCVTVSENIPVLKIDKDKIIQVLTNLVSNAVKFTDRGTVVVEASCTSENAVRVSVSDTGIGIRQEDVCRLFHSFSQVAPAQYRKSGSTGLGLAISKRIIQKHGGKIGVDSVWGKGSTFYFLLPIVERRKGTE